MTVIFTNIFIQCRLLCHFSQYPNLHNSYVNCFIDSVNGKRDASSVLMEYYPESCIWKVKYLCIKVVIITNLEQKQKSA